LKGFLISLIIVIIIVFSEQEKAFSSDFNVERMNVDFRGVCHNDKVTIAYGTGGIILYSTDKGTSWSQKKNS
jgi:hypothetical protein